MLGKPFLDLQQLVSSIPKYGVVNSRRDVMWGKHDPVPT